MNHWSTAVVFAAGLGLGACGGGAAPVVSNFDFQPKVIEAGRETLIAGTLDFRDEDMDTNGLLGALTPVEGSGSTPSFGPSPLEDTEGKLAGTIQFSFSVLLSPAGRYNFVVWLRDDAGHDSNKALGTLDVR